MWINRHKCRANDVRFEIKYCGICHSDLHIAKAEFPDTIYPLVPGHEMAGVVTEVGSEVKGIAVGDHVGVGCYVDSCLECSTCDQGEENYCEKGKVLSFNKLKLFKGVGGNPEAQTFGGFSRSYVV